MRNECTIKRQGLYDPSLEHDACGIGAVVHIKGTKSHKVVSDALTIVERLEHRAGKEPEGRIGDGVGDSDAASAQLFSEAMQPYAAGKAVWSRDVLLSTGGAGMP